MADDMMTRSELLTSDLKRLSGRVKALKLVLARCGSKVTTNDSVNIIHEQVDDFCSSGVTEFLPNNVQVATNDVTKLGSMRSTCELGSEGNETINMNEGAKMPSMKK